MKTSTKNYSLEDRDDLSRFQGVFICFTGIDGSGKTTLSSSLLGLIRGKNVKCKYVWSRYEPILAKPLFSLARMFLLRKKGTRGNYDVYRGARRSLFENKPLSSLYMMFTVPDYILQNLVKVRVALWRGDCVLADRYVYDFVVDLAIDLERGSEYVTRRTDFFFRFLPRPAITFLMDVPEEVAMKRKLDVPDVEYLARRRSLYASLASRKDVVTVDGRKPQSELKQIVLAEVREAAS